MSKQIAKNTFTGGLLMDSNPLSSQNTVLTNALNATLVTIDGDEMILQNDMGNLKVTYTEKDGYDQDVEIDVTLTPGFIPIGINTLNGIAYIVSFNPTTQEGEIGTFPSPNYNLTTALGETVLANDENEGKEELIYKYQPLYNLYKGSIDGHSISPKQDDVIEGLLFALRTTHFNFDLQHPVSVELQPSYDGSVNIIINDGKNMPRLINSRFSAKEDGTWKIPDRHRNTNNIYKVYDGEAEDYKEPMCECEGSKIKNGIKDIECGCHEVSCEQEIKNQLLFDISTSLNKRINSFPIVRYEGVLDTGNLPVGNYTLYFKYCDEDGNETDFIAESGIISVFKGNDADPFSIDGGERDMDSNKSINITLLYNDPAYSFVKVYYARTSAAADENRVSQAFEIIKSYPININDKINNNDIGTCNIIINGDEEKQQIPITDLSLQLTVINSAESQVLIANRLFLGNVKSQDLFYKQLTNLSLHVVPYIKRIKAEDKIGLVSTRNYEDISTNINNNYFNFNYEYYNTKNIYYNVGYWNEEYYRLGIVYIFEDGSLSPVFNILGYNANVEYEGNERKGVIIEHSNMESGQYQDLKNKIISEQFSIVETILYNDEGYIYNTPSFLNDYFISNSNRVTSLNAKGIIKLSDDEVEKTNDSTYIGKLNKLGEKENKLHGNYLYSIGVYLDNKLISELKNKYCVKGFFIVRQKRIPTILAQGFTMPWDKEAKVPIIEYWGSRHDYSRGVTVSDEGGNGYRYDKIFPITKNLFLSKFDGNKFIAIKRRCDIVESFLLQNGADSFGMADPKNTNDLNTDHDEKWTYQAYNRGAAVHHEYLQRLHEILPLTIDDEMIHKLGANDVEEQDIKFKHVYMRIYISGLWYILKESEDEESSYQETNQPVGYPKEVDEYDALEQIIEYSSYITNPYLEEERDYIYMGNFDGKEYYCDVSDITRIEYCNNYTEEGSNTWIEGGLTASIKNNGNYYSDYDLRTETTNEETAYLEIYGDTGNGSEQQLASIQKVKLTGGGQSETSYAEYKSDSTIGHGYSTVNPYYMGAMVHRLTGEIWEDDIYPYQKVFNGQSDQWEHPLTYIPDYYMNGRLAWKMLFHVAAYNSRYAKTIVDRFLGGVSLATQKHFYNLYKYCDKLQLTAICPEFEVRQPFFNLLFTGATYWCRYNKYQHGILHRKKTNERYYYQWNGTSERENWEITTKDWLNNAPDKELYFYYAMADGVWLQEGNFQDYTERQYKIVSVTDTVPVVAIDNTIFKSVLGSEQEAYRFVYINEEHAPKRGFKHVKSGQGDEILCNTRNEMDFNLARGYYTPYLGMVCAEYENKDYNKFSKELYWKNEKGRGYGRNFTIYDESWKNDFKTNADIRIEDSSPYYAISERITFEKVSQLNEENVNGMHYVKNNNHILYDLYRGDCFLYTFTHRLNRNFNDPVAPTNDHIINPTTWRDHYRPDDTDTDSTEGTTKMAKINRGDVNAVKLGSWITVKGRASYNLSIRSLDERYVTESAMMGRARGFYPVQQASADGGYKIPNSYLINDGFGSTVGEKMYVGLPEAPYYNNEFQDRIVYSDVNIQDSYKNGYRVFKTASITDYTKQYGKIVKLVDWYGHILCVFEHAVGILPVNERIESGEGIGGPVFIDNNKVIPDNPSIISDKFGSQWKDSIIKTPYAVYGVDTSTKKIWKITGSTTLPTLSVISDFKIENFLKEHLPTMDNDTDLYIALKNVKSHYNLTKADVMFTFYADKVSTERRLLDFSNKINPDGSGPTKKNLDEYAWSICLNEITSDLNTQNSGNFVTFYSWIPLESFNLNNKYYSFDREMVRGMLSFPKTLNNEDGFQKIPRTHVIEYIGKPLYTMTEDRKYELADPNSIDYCNGDDYYTPLYKFKLPCNGANEEVGLNLWEHNNPFIRPLPTHWYGKQHPFEFEFVVLEDPSVQKIWEDLKIISNNAEPESFHFSITGDNYEFTEDIPNIYFRQEATKNLYHNLGSHISYNEDYHKIHPNQLIKSTIFPLYYNRLDIFDTIYDTYELMPDNKVYIAYQDATGHRDYQNLSGTEVYRNPRSRKFELTTHIKNTPIDGHWVRLTEQNYTDYFEPKEYYKSLNLYLEEKYINYYSIKYSNDESVCNNIFTTYDCNKMKKEKKPKNAFLCNEEYWYYIWVPQSRLRGNSHYKEDRWNIQIPSITLMQKNENRWTTSINPRLPINDLKIPPIVLNGVPKDIPEGTVIRKEDLPNTYDIGLISLNKWTFRKEAKIRDKYCRIKVRYSGEELAIISAILTTFNISYA